MSIPAARPIRAGCASSSPRRASTLPTETVDLGAQAHKTPQYRAVNPMQRLPALVLDDGTVIAESIAICRYVEALHPQPPLFGEGALEQALVEMWQRRVEFHLLDHRLERVSPPASRHGAARGAAGGGLGRGQQAARARVPRPSWTAS